MTGSCSSPPKEKILSLPLPIAILQQNTYTLTFELECSVYQIYNFTLSCCEFCLSSYLQTCSFLQDLKRKKVRHPLSDILSYEESHQHWKCFVQQKTVRRNNTFSPVMQDTCLHISHGLQLLLELTLHFSLQLITYDMHPFVGMLH